MSGLFARDDGVAARYQVADGPRPGGGELFAANFTDAQIRGDANAQTYRRRKELLEALADRLGPEGSRYRQAFDRSAVLPERDVEALMTAVRSAAERDPSKWADAPLTRQAAFDKVAKQLRAEIDAAQLVMGRQTGLADAAVSFAGQIAGTAADLPNVIMSLPGFAAKSFGRMVLYEAGLGAGAEAIALPRIAAVEKQLGLEPTDPFMQIGAGAVFGAALPIAGRGARVAWRGAAAVSNSDLLAAARARVARLRPVERAAAARLEDDAAARANAPGEDQDADVARLDRAAEAAAQGRPELIPETAPRADALAPGAPRRVSLEDRIIGVESGGRADAANPNSSALGAGQFIAGTWLEMLRKHRPELLEGRSEAEALALRTDPDLSRQMTAAYARDNRAWLGEQGLPIHDGAVYLAHFAGPAGAARALRAAADAPIRDVMSDAEIAANRAIRFNGKSFEQFTAGDLIGWAKSKMGIADAAIGDLPAATRAQYPADEVLTDAGAFQYKSGGDAEGVTARLLFEREWDPVAGSGLTFFEALDGRVFVADGHQRSGLARRLMAAGHAPITLDGFVYREADGWTRPQVRAMAALTNIRALTGTATDAAKVMRDFPELGERIARGPEFVRRADALARLAPETFEAVVNEVIPENLGAVIGRVAPGDERLQRAILKAFRQLEPANELEADLMARDVRRLGLERETEGAQMSLFGDDFDFGASPIGERARVLDQTVKELKRDKAVFERLTREADRIEQEGNRLARTQNERRAAQQQRILEAVLIASDEPGPVRDALDAAARTARAKSVAAGAREFAEAVRAGIDSGVVGRAFDRAAVRRAEAPLGDGPGEGAARAALGDPEPPALSEAGEIPPGLFDDPAGPEARAATVALEEDLLAQAAPAPAREAATGLRDVVRKAGEPGDHPRAFVRVGAVTDGFVRVVQDEAGIDLSGYQHSVDVYGVRHILSEHGDPAAERSRGQVAITEADIAEIPQTLAAATHAVVGLQSRRGQPVIGLIARRGDGSIVYVEEVRTKRRTLAAITMWKYPAEANAESVLSALRRNVRDGRGDGVKVVELSPDAKPIDAPDAPDEFAASRDALERDLVGEDAVSGKYGRLLFDALDEPTRAQPVNLSEAEGGDLRALGEIVQELDDELRALDAMDACRIGGER